MTRILLFLAFSSILLAFDEMEDLFRGSDDRFAANRTNTFITAWNKEENYLVDEEESRDKVYNRLGSQQILNFLEWWEKKYLLSAMDLEGLYGGQHVLEQKHPGRYWKKLSSASKNKLRLSWFFDHSGKLFEEYAVYLKMKGQQDGFPINPEF